MTRRQPASIARVLVALLVALPAVADEPATPDPSRIVVTAGPAPVVDGRIGEAEWEGATSFTIRRGKDTYADTRMRRVGRQLYIALDSTLPPWTVGLRFVFGDPVSGRSNLVLVTPVNPPRSPISTFRRLADRDAERVASAACDVRFAYREQGFSCEMRLPLDLLEIAPTEKTYAFSLEIWALGDDRAIAAFPQSEVSATVEASPAAFVSEGAWGAEAAQEEAPQANGTIAFLEEVSEVTDEGPVFERDAGWMGGRRNGAALEALEKRAKELAAACPDLISLHAFLVHVRAAMNDLQGALRALDAQGKVLPMLKESPRDRMLRAQILRDLARYDEALALLQPQEDAPVPHGDAPADAPEEDPDLVAERNNIGGLREAWRVETMIRKAEAERDDLPRVRLKTSKGDIDIELYEDDSPNGVANFISLIEAGFYDGTRFHWVDGGGRAMGGDPNSRDDDPHNDGFGDPGYVIESEPGRRTIFPMTVGYVDKRRQRRTEGCTFAIHLSAFPIADGVNTVLGRVISGEDVVRKLSYYDTIEKTSVLRKRNHPYTPTKR